MTAAPRTVVVGYDGSATARRAFDLAAERAEGGTLYVVYAYDVPGPMKSGNAYDRVVGQHKQVGQDVLAGLPELPGVTVERELIGDHPAVAIANVAEVREADEIVVGSRGFSSLRGALGSTSHELLHRAHCPVTVVPAEPGE